MCIRCSWMSPRNENAEGSVVGKFWDLVNPGCTLPGYPYSNNAAVCQDHFAAAFAFARVHTLTNRRVVVTPEQCPEEQHDADSLLIVRRLLRGCLVSTIVVEINVSTVMTLNLPF